MTDNEIKKALEYWRQFDKEIDDMLHGGFKGDKMLMEQKEMVQITFGVFDLINRQQAEIDILIRKKETLRDEIAEQQAEIERLQKAITVLEIMADQHQYALQKAKSEGAKEFAEMVKAKCGKLITYRAEVIRNYTGIVAGTEYRIPSEFIDDIVKRIGGEQRKEDEKNEAN